MDTTNAAHFDPAKWTIAADRAIAGRTTEDVLRELAKSPTADPLIAALVRRIDRKIARRAEKSNAR